MTENEPESKKSESQAGEGYKCLCGYITDSRQAFFHHMGAGARADGPGVHKSLGRVNLISGDIVMPPYPERTKEQKAESTHGLRTQKGLTPGKVTAVRTTDILASASEIKFIPRIFTTTYTPIMHQAQDAAVKWFGWPSNMQFEDFLDTVLFKAFDMWGIKLGQYGVDEDLVKAAHQREAEQLVGAGKTTESNNESENSEGEN